MKFLYSFHRFRAKTKVFDVKKKAPYLVANICGQLTHLRQQRFYSDFKIPYIETEGTQKKSLFQERNSYKKPRIQNTNVKVPAGRRWLRTINQKNGGILATLFPNQKPPIWRDFSRFFLEFVFFQKTRFLYLCEPDPPFSGRFFFRARRAHLSPSYRNPLF